MINVGWIYRLKLRCTISFSVRPWFVYCSGVGTYIIVIKYYVWICFRHFCPNYLLWNLFSCLKYYQFNMWSSPYICDNVYIRLWINYKGVRYAGVPIRNRISDKIKNRKSELWKYSLHKSIPFNCFVIGFIVPA